jgi:hypothetical protein
MTDATLTVSLSGIPDGRLAQLTRDFERDLYPAQVSGPDPSRRRPLRDREGNQSLLECWPSR